MGAKSGDATRAVNTSAAPVVLPVGIGKRMFGMVFASTVPDDNRPEEPAGAAALSARLATDGLPPTTSRGLTATGKGPVAAQTSLNWEPLTGGRISQPKEHSCLNVQVPSCPTGLSGGTQSKRFPAEPNSSSKPACDCLTPTPKHIGPWF